MLDVRRLDEGNLDISFDSKRFTNVFKGNKIEEWNGTQWNYAQDSLVKDFNSGRSVELLCPAEN